MTKKFKGKYAYDALTPITKEMITGYAEYSLILTVDNSAEIIKLNQMIKRTVDKVCCSCNVKLNVHGRTEFN